MSKNYNVVILTGAGISAESGISTFRDANGLWENHDIQEVATPEGFAKNPELVLRFYNQRRQQLHQVAPNAAHLAITKLANHTQVKVVTQNIDDLHERAGNPFVLHLHGELFKARSTVNERHIVEWKGDIQIGDLCPQNGQMRPHIVWFGEMVPKLPEAIQLVEKATHIIIVGTSMKVYPAASLVDYAGPNVPIYYIDPKPAINEMMGYRRINVIPEVATIGLSNLVDQLILELEP